MLRPTLFFFNKWGSELRLGNFTSETVNTACEFVITELTHMCYPRDESCGPYPKKNKYIKFAQSTREAP